MTFKNRVGAALVVGASGGIGQEIAAQLSDQGAKVAITYRNGQDAAAALVAKLPHAKAYQLDLAIPGACAAVLAEVLADFDEVHTLVYAAGPHVPMQHLSKLSVAEFSAQLSQDTLGFIDLATAALPTLRASRGNIVAVTTAATDRYPVRDGLSAVPKAAIEAFVRGIAVEEGRFGVRANCVGPGMLTDGMAARLIDSGELDEHALAVTMQNIPLRKFGTAVDIAAAVSFLASDAAGFITGQKINVDGGYSC